VNKGNTKEVTATLQRCPTEVDRKPKEKKVTKANREKEKEVF